MQVERIDYEYGTEILIGSAQAGAYTVICSDVGRDKALPTARIYLPKTRTLGVEDVQRIARELDYVADVAAALQAEKRAAFGPPADA